MFDKLTGIEARYEELDRLLADPATLNDYSKVTELAQERAAVEPIVEAFRRYRRATQELDDAKALIESETDEDLRAMAQEESESLSSQITTLEEQLKTMLLPKDPRDDKNVIVEIRA